VTLTYEAPDIETATVEEFLRKGMGASAAAENVTLIRVLAARIVEERWFTERLHVLMEHEMPTFDGLEGDELKAALKREQFYAIERDQSAKRVESLSRIISSIWTQLGFSGESPTETFFGNVQDMVNNRKEDSDGN